MKHGSPCVFLLGQCLSERLWGGAICRGLSLKGFGKALVLESVLKAKELHNPVSPGGMWQQVWSKMMRDLLIENYKRQKDQRHNFCET